MRAITMFDRNKIGRIKKKGSCNILVFYVCAARAIFIYFKSAISTLDPKAYARIDYYLYNMNELQIVIHKIP